MSDICDSSKKIFTLFVDQDDLVLVPGGGCGQCQELLSNLCNPCNHCRRPVKHPYVVCRFSGCAICMTFVAPALGTCCLG